MSAPSAARASRQEAFAKVNLGLRVLDRRPDGYHNVRTVMQSIGLADDVSVTVEPACRRRVTLECDRKDLEHEGNLAWMAADRLLRIVPRPTAVHVSLRKRIPSGAGLGGGSSDAAAVLRALAKLLPAPPRRRDLLEVAAGIGSDVPYFLVGGTAVAAGRGTELTAQPDLPAAPLVLVLPDIEVSTARAYRELAASRGTGLTDPPESRTMKNLGSVPSVPEEGASFSLSEPMHNDFEDVVFHRFPAIADIKARLLACGARHALMSGSGSAVFGIFSSSAGARQVAADLACRGLRAEASRFRTRSECGCVL